MLMFCRLGYYYASCAALNITDSNDLDSIRAMICQTRYLASAEMLTKAYARISAAMAQGLRMGLHVASSNPSLKETFSDEELFQRRRVFASLNMYETFVSSTVGIPRTTRTADATQMVGLYLTEDGRSFVDHRPDSPIAETATLEKLCIIAGEIMEDRHPLNPGQSETTDEPWEAASDMVPTREAELERWHSNLPTLLPDIPSNQRAIKAQLQIRMWYALVQLVLYRPFVHHLGRDRRDPKFNAQGYEWGSAAVKAAMQGVWVIETGQQYGIFHEAHFGQVYTLCFAAVILVYFVTSSQQQTTVKESAISALRAIDMLGMMGKHNIVARRCCNTLTAMIEHLPISPESLRNEGS